MLAWLGTFAIAISAQDLTVQVQRRGGTVVIDVQASVPAPVPYTWAALTDYVHMADYISAVKSSQVERQQDNLLEVTQVVELDRGLIHYVLNSTRSVELLPMREIRSRLISGDFKSYDFTTQVIDLGETSRIVHHGEYVPNIWVPPIIGPLLIKKEAQVQFRQFLAEIERRKGLGDPSSAPPHRPEATPAPGDPHD